MFRKINRSVRDEPPAHFNFQQQRDRAADELVGMCRIMLADGAVSATEAGFLKDWIELNAQYAGSYPFNYLYQRLADAFADGVLDADEEADLLATVGALVGGEANLPGKASLSTALPLCTPPPEIEFEGKCFVATGTFMYGPRSSVVDKIEGRGGVVKTSISTKVNFLVIGEVGSQAWRHSSYGRKIEKAVDLRDSGVPIGIVSEQHWVASAA